MYTQEHVALGKIRFYNGRAQCFEPAGVSDALCEFVRGTGNSKQMVVC